jgi:hypothetical protein
LPSSHSLIDHLLSSTFNNTLIEYDPYTKGFEIIKFSNITGNDDYLLSGVDYNSKTGNIYISANARAAFFSNGANLDGPNTLIEYNPKKRHVTKRIDMESTISQVENHVGQAIGGFQDQAEDSDGNVYYMSTWGNVILKAKRNGHVSPFYIPPADQFNSSAPGFGGIAICGSTLLVSDAISQSFFKFDLQHPNTKPSSIQPAGLPSSQPVLLCDSVYLPERYGKSVAICASDFAFGVGGLTVYSSTDGWRSINYLGSILNDFIQSPNGTATATFEATGTIYAVVAYIHSTTGEQPSSSNFPFVDITKRVHELVFSSDTPFN